MLGTLYNIDIVFLKIDLKIDLLYMNFLIIIIEFEYGTD